MRCSAKKCGRAVSRMRVVARVLLQPGTARSWTGTWVPGGPRSGCASHHGAVSSPARGSADVAASVPPARCRLRGYPRVTLQQTVPKLEGLRSDGPLSLWSLPSRSSAGMQNLGRLLHPSSVTEGHSCSRTKQDVLFAPLLPSESVTYLT